MSLFFIVSYRKEIETQVTTGYNQSIQKNDSEHGNAANPEGDELQQ